MLDLCNAVEWAVAVIDPKDRFAYANPAAREVLRAGPDGRGTIRLCAELAAEVAQVRATGQPRPDRVLEVGRNSMRWRGGLWPLDAGYVGVILVPNGAHGAATIADKLGVSVPEARLARFVAAGKSNQEIAEATRVSLSAVKARVSRLYRKLDVSNRAELAAKVAAAVRAAGPGPDRNSRMTP